MGWQSGPGAARDSDVPASGRRAVRRRRHVELPVHPPGHRRRVCRRTAVLPVAAAGRRNGHGLPDVADPGRRSGVPATIRVDDPADLPEAINHCRTLLDLDADPAAIDAVLSTDPTLAPAVAAMPGLRVPGAVDGPEILVRATLGQQVSVAGAQTAATWLVLAADDRLPSPDGPLTHLFPTPAAIAELGPGLIAGPRRRALAICGAAAAMAEGSLTVTADRTTEGSRPIWCPDPASDHGPPVTWRCGCSAIAMCCSPATCSSRGRRAAGPAGHPHGTGGQIGELAAVSGVRRHAPVAGGAG